MQIQAVTIEFEHDAKYITAFGEGGKVIIRCNFELTDCTDEETLPKFIERHGGVRATAIYLHDCFKRW